MNCNKAKFLVLSLLIFFSFSSCAQKGFEVYALKYAILKEPPAIANWVEGGPEDRSIPVSFHFWLIKTPESKNILVDAGCRIDLQNAVDFGLTDFERPDSVLMRLGISPNAISDIIVSHPHWDHIDGLPLFPNANVWIQKEDYQYYTGEAWQGESKPGGIAQRNIEYLLQLNMNGKLKWVDGDNQKITDGITAYTGSRHTYNSQYVVVQSKQDRVVIASDNVWVYYNLEKMAPAPSYGTWDAAGYVKNMERMKTQASKPDFILPGHDDAMFSRFPKVNERVIRIL